ncbi:MAG: DUF2239 family protein [Actinobacteria bacterium]|nr:DUF2239 family protein [Actinomycetota bacterium]
MRARLSTSCTAFAGTERIASGPPREVAQSTRARVDAGDARTVLIFDDATAEPIEMDFRGSIEDVLRRLSDDASDDGDAADVGDPETALPARAPGRPRLGVVGREVTLLPRHWAWLSAQPGGASVALRKLVEQARRVNEDRDRARRSQEVAFKFMSAMAGNEPGFEEASRALFAGDRQRFAEHTAPWPPDVRTYAAGLAANAFAGQGTSTE